MLACLTGRFIEMTLRKQSHFADESSMAASLSHRYICGANLITSQLFHHCIDFILIFQSELEGERRMGSGFNIIRKNKI